MRDISIGHAGIVFSFLLVGCAFWPDHAIAQQDMASLVRRSGFVFAGRIEKLGAATAGLQATPETAVVRVTRVIDRQPPVDEIAGHLVTVRLRDAGQAKPGRDAVFFTYVYGGGSSLGLNEVSELPDGNGIDQSVRAARDAIADAALRARLESADIVAAAKVLRTGRVESGTPRGEHEPMWWTATLEVVTAFKGDASKGAIVSVRFPSNDDAYWGAAPKPKPGDTAIFLLQPARAVAPLVPAEPGERRETEALRGLFLADRLDEVGLGEAERVRRLLNK
ncbi:MAG: hypothetical protein JOZ72_07690 [Alphaproteobacteria bacterium]|nr:hypothetical protein [Alphaproteobacteria bacterium]